MPLQTLTHQVIALAGVTQAATLVQQLATKGSADNVALHTSIGSVLKIDADSVVDVYGGKLTGLQLGLEQLAVQMSSYKITNAEQGRYVASLIFLEQQLLRNAQMTIAIQIGIGKAQTQAEQFGLLHDNVLANLGDLYFSNISQLQPRILVNGEADYLSRPEIANKIRACLLAGIRSARLWQQCGGTRWKFLFQRKIMYQELQRLLQSLPATP